MRSCARSTSLHRPRRELYGCDRVLYPMMRLRSLVSQLLLAEAKVAVAPGVGFGEYGDTHVRIALVENEHRIRQAARNVRRFLSKADPDAGAAALRIKA